MNSIQGLQYFGQSIWLDYISRSLITSGELKRLINMGVSGVTSNPSIFQKAFCETSDYDCAIKTVLQSQPNIDASKLYETLAIEDIQDAADCLLPVYNSSQQTDGFVSFEVSPHLFAKLQDTIADAERLWNSVSRPNLMIKVPATPECIPAIEHLISRGINVNATLIFSLPQYEQVALAYIRGLEKSPDPSRVTSVASFFVSRIDTIIDKSLQKANTPEALSLCGKSAISCAKIVYHSMNNIFYGKPFEKQKMKGGKVQKLVWGSTGTKNPRYSDVIYIEEIIGKDTINTIPMATLKAFMDHGKPRLSILENFETAKTNISKLKKYDIDLTVITDRLLSEGVLAFIQAYDKLLDNLKRHSKQY
jgi:transaldolase